MRGFSDGACAGPGGAGEAPPSARRRRGAVLAPDRFGARADEALRGLDTRGAAPSPAGLTVSPIAIIGLAILLLLLFRC